MTAKKNPKKKSTGKMPDETKTSPRTAPKKPRVGSDKEIREELGKVPIHVVADIAASLYRHDLSPAISLLKAYELLEGAIIARDALLAGKSSIDAAFGYNVVWNDEERTQHFVEVTKPKPDIPDESISWTYPDGRVTYPLDEALVSFMPNHSKAVRMRKYEWFIDELDELLETEKLLRDNFRETSLDWDGKWAQLPPEPEGYEVGMIYTPSRQIAEWSNDGIPAVIYEISRQRIREWLKIEKSHKNAKAAKARWNKQDPDSTEGKGEQPDNPPPKSKSGKGKVKSKKDKRLGPKLPDAGKKLKKIIEGA